MNTPGTFSTGTSFRAQILCTLADGTQVYGDDRLVLERNQAVFDALTLRARVIVLEKELDHPTLREYRQVKVDAERYREVLESIKGGHSKDPQLDAIRALSSEENKWNA